MANVKIVRATYLVIDGTTYKPPMRQPPEKDWKNWKGFRTSFMTKPVA